jgi:hypothetical protein
MRAVKTTDNFIISESEFNDMFPNRNPIYTYKGLVTAAAAFSSSLVGVTEEITLTNMLVFLANASHETTGDGYASGTFDNGLYFVIEGGDATAKLCAITPAQTPWCNGYGITPDGTQSYYGRGALQLSYQSNYQAANDGIPNNPGDIYNNPKAVVEDSYLAWATALWFWCTPQGNKPACSTVIDGQWIPTENDTLKGRINTTFANRMGVVTDIINGGIEAGSWDAETKEVIPLIPADSQPNEQAINRQQYYQYFVDNFFANKNADVMAKEEYGINQASHMTNFNF